MFGRTFTSKSSNRSVRRNRTLSANLDPRKISNNRPASRHASRAATRSFLNSIRKTSKAVGNRMRTTSKAVGSRLGSIVPAMNKRGLLPYSRIRNRRREDTRLRNNLESEIVRIIESNQGKSSEELKKELVHMLDKKIGFNHEYLHCYQSKENYKIASVFEDIIFKMYAYPDSEYRDLKNILERVKKTADDRKYRCQPGERSNWSTY
jgi:hypothetical protein